MACNTLDLSIIILTHNEELHIERCINNIQKISKQIFIVDSFSTDNTVLIAETLGVTVIQHKWTNYAQQFQWGIDNLPIQTQWVMRFDADELLTDELIDELHVKLPSLSHDITGIALKRRHYFLGKWIKHGDRYPLVLLRLWKKGCAHIEQRWMDEHMVLDKGRSVLLESDFSDINLNNIDWFIDKHNKYASREMLDILNQKYSFSFIDQSIEANETTQAKFKRYLKENIYNNFPIFIRPCLYFLYRYIVRLGFLDGKEGFAYHFMQGFWYRCLVDLKCIEAEKILSDYDKLDKKSIVIKLKELTKLDIL